jgi:RNA polymerase subunit RPABC4/transcription elongation factor Spt4
MEIERKKHVYKESDGHKGSMRIMFPMPKCCHQCQRKIFLDSWFGQLVVIDVNPWRVILEIDVNPSRSPVENFGSPDGVVLVTIVE